jgi:hypothetical protein
MTRFAQVHPDAFLRGLESRFRGRADAPGGTKVVTGEIAVRSAAVSFAVTFAPVVAAPAMSLAPQSFGASVSVMPSKMRILARPVVAAAGQQPDAHGVAPGHEPIAVVLDLVNPVGARGRTVGRRWEAGLNEGSTRHAPYLGGRGPESSRHKWTVGGIRATAKTKPRRLRGLAVQRTGRRGIGGDRSLSRRAF